MHRIHGFLSGNDLQELERLLSEGAFSDGLSSVGAHGQEVKSNLQLDSTDPNGPLANQLVHRVLSESPEFKAYAMPFKVSSITFSRYQSGMKYGDHTDNPVNMSRRGVIRSDLSFTIFLSPPDEYDGGELVANVLGSEVPVKLDRGDMVIYPSGLMHRVNEVTRGCRKVAIGWLQSRIPSQEQREVVQAIDNVMHDMLNSSGRTGQFNQLSFAQSNLVRMWTKV
jgi:PKHD-type hydroxylase